MQYSKIGIILKSVYSILNIMVGTNTKSYSVCIRVPMGLKERIDQDIVESGDYASASQWYLAAVRDYVEKREKIRKDRLGGGGGPNNS